MKLTLGSAWPLLLIGCFLILETESINYSQPISPGVFSKLLGNGFDASFFKPEPLAKYHDQNIDDVYNAGFRNLRIRCPAWMYPPYETENFTKFLDGLETLVNRCLKKGVVPILSWAHGEAEHNATDEDRANYIAWWTAVAKKLKKKDYRLGFNLFTELAKELCEEKECPESLRENTEKYNKWTKMVVKAIRGTGENNDKRILILSSPKKRAAGLAYIDKSIYETDNYMMAEYHLYASGPTHRAKSPKFWVGNGTTAQRKVLLDELETARKIPLQTYFGEWMPHNNQRGTITQTEAESFAKYFVSVLKDQNIPWSLNALNHYYKTKTRTWITDIQNKSGQFLNMSRVLDVIKKTM